jgi:glucose/mannose transport system permease protein
MGVCVLVAYVASILWTLRISLSTSKMLPRNDWAGFSQYINLFGTDRWLTSMTNVAVFGLFFIVGAIVLGFLLAVFIDQKVRLEGVFRTVYLYSFAMSFVACGVIWQWMFNPTLGIQRSLRSWGWESARFDWITTQDMAIYCVVICVLWHSSGLVMAILLAGLRGIDDEQWKAARIEGVPRWRYYLNIVLPQLGPSLATAVVLLAVSVVKLFDAVVSMTNGGPGDATDVPTKFIIDNLFERQNIGLASAASATMLVTVIVIVAPLLYARSRANAAAGHA